VKKTNDHAEPTKVEC